MLFSRALGNTYLRGHDDFAIGPTQDRYYLAPDVHHKCEDLRSNQPLFLVLSVRHRTHLESTVPSRMGAIEIEVLLINKLFECVLTGTLNKIYLVWLLFCR